MFNAVRSMIAVIAALLLAGVGLAFLVWLLRRLWGPGEEAASPAAIEIEARAPTEEGGLMAVEAEEEMPAAVADVPDLEVEEEVQVEDVEIATGDVEAEVSTVEEPPVPPAPDDLKRIEGIGPKIASVLQAAGVSTFAQLADTDVDQLRRILEESDPRLLRLAKPASWPEQASLAAAGNWDALQALQAELKAGRKR